MIDLYFENYQECKLTNIKKLDSHKVQQWTHVTVSFSSEPMPNEIEDPVALLILNEAGNILQIVLQEEGCDSPHFQFTDQEKKQLIEWFEKEVEN